MIEFKTSNVLLDANMKPTISDFVRIYAIGSNNESLNQILTQRVSIGGQRQGSSVTEGM